MNDRCWRSHKVRFVVDGCRNGDFGMHHPTKQHSISKSSKGTKCFHAIEHTAVGPRSYSTMMVSALRMLQPRRKTAKWLQKPVQKDCSARGVCYYFGVTFLCFIVRRWIVVCLPWRVIVIKKEEMKANEVRNEWVICCVEICSNNLVHVLSIQNA